MNRQIFSFTLGLFALFVSSEALGQGKVISLLKGELLDQSGVKVAGANIAVFKGYDKVITTKSTPEGKFQGILPGAGTYRITIKSDNYLYVEDTIDLQSLGSYRETPYHRQLIRLVSGSTLPLSAKVFSFASSDLTPAAKDELASWALAAKQNPRLSYEITAYPDADIRNKKKDAAQLKLVKARAQVIQSYFTGKGVSVSVAISENRSPLGGLFEETIKLSKKKSAVRSEPQKLQIITRLR